MRALNGQTGESKGRFRIHKLEDRIAPSLVGSLLPCLTSLTGALHGDSGCHPGGDPGDHPGGDNDGAHPGGCDSAPGGDNGGDEGGHDMGHPGDDNGGGDTCDGGAPTVHAGADINICASASVGSNCGGADAQSHESASAHVDLDVDV
jgi:hypothetical protein